MSDKESTDEDVSVDGYIGVAQTGWIKFKIAGIAWALTRGTDSAIVAKLPYTKRIAKWAFEVRVMSRDMELDIEGLEQDHDNSNTEPEDDME